MTPPSGRKAESAGTSLTAVYSAAHGAFSYVADAHALTRFEVRLLVAVLDRGGSTTTAELEADLGACGSSVRRASLTLRASGHVLADAGPGTSQPVRGCRARISLTAEGRVAAEHSVRLARKMAELMTVAT